VGGTRGADWLVGSVFFLMLPEHPSSLAAKMNLTYQLVSICSCPPFGIINVRGITANIYQSCAVNFQALQFIFILQVRYLG
jgi:hypothetical protein